MYFASYFHLRHYSKCLFLIILTFILRLFFLFHVKIWWFVFFISTISCIVLFFHYTFFLCIIFQKKIQNPKKNSLWYDGWTEVWFSLYFLFVLLIFLVLERCTEPGRGDLIGIGSSGPITKGTKEPNWAKRTKMAPYMLPLVNFYVSFGQKINKLIQGNLKEPVVLLLIPCFLGSFLPFLWANSFGQTPWRCD